MLNAVGKNDESLRRCDEAIQIFQTRGEQSQTDLYFTQVNRGITLGLLGRTPEAVESRGAAAGSPRACNSEAVGRLAGYAISALNPLHPTSTLVRPPATNIACPMAAAANPIAAWPSRMKIQVSGSATKAQLILGKHHALQNEMPD